MGVHRVRHMRSIAANATIGKAGYVGGLGGLAEFEALQPKSPHARFRFSTVPGSQAWNRTTPLYSSTLLPCQGVLSACPRSVLRRETSPFWERSARVRSFFLLPLRRASSSLFSFPMPIASCLTVERASGPDSASSSFESAACALICSLTVASNNR